MKGFTIPAIFKAIDQFSAPMKTMQNSLGAFANKMNDTSKKAFQVAGAAAVVGASILAPLGVAANSAVKFEDQLADVGKTTGLQGKELDEFGDKILKLALTTRTSIPDILKISEIGGQLGVAKDELIAFTDASNKFAVALANDYSGGVEGAISSVGKIKSLFKEIRQTPIDDVINRAGSVINELGAVGAGTSENINDFILRIGALPDALKPSMTATAALGTFFEEVGIDAQIASGGLSNFFLVAGKDIGKFAQQMKMPVEAAKQLLATDSAEFAKKFALSLNGLKPDVLAKKLNDLKIGSQESIKVLGALGASTERVTELQKIAGDAYANGTSLTDEYNKKNATNAALLAQAKNNFEALSITVGTQLLPVISDLLKKMMPVIQGVMDWMKEHETLTKTIILGAAALGVLMFGISGVAAIIGVITKAIWLWEVAQWAINAAMTANPVGAIIVAVAALIAVVVMAVKHFDEWGAAVLAMVGPIGWVVLLIKTLADGWDRVKYAFKTDGIIGGLKAIGKTLLDVVLYPLQQILEIASNLPGKMGDWAAAGAANIKRFREEMGMAELPIARQSNAQRAETYEMHNTPAPARVMQQVDTRTAKEEAYSAGLAKKLNFGEPQKMEVTVKAAPGTEAEVTKKSKGITPVVKPSLGFQ